MNKLTPLEGMREIERQIALESCSPELASLVRNAIHRAEEDGMPPERFSRLLVALAECLEQSDDTWALSLYERALEMNPRLRIRTRLERVKRRIRSGPLSVFNHDDF